MALERWGTFSVIDHRDLRSLIPEVLLYDRLVVPVPPDEGESRRWRKEGWDPDLLDERLEMLGDLALRKPWGVERHAKFRDRMEEIRLIEYNGAAQAEYGEVLPYAVTRDVLRDEVHGEHGDEILVVAAYGSEEEFLAEVALGVEEEQRVRSRLGLLLQHELLLPAIAAPPEEAFRAVLELVRTGEFREKRAALYGWQDDVIARRRDLGTAVAEMRDLVADYNRLVANAARERKETRIRTAYTVAGLGADAALLALGAATAEPLVSALGLAATGAVFAQWIHLDWRRATEPEAARPEAMFHAARKALG